MNYKCITCKDTGYISEDLGCQSAIIKKCICQLKIPSIDTVYKAIMAQSKELQNTPVTKVVYCKKEKYDIYIGRPSKWGNPFSIGKDGTREEVIEKYKNWIVLQTDLLGSLHELRGKTLGCWCKPKACHGDVLAELAELYTQENIEKFKRQIGFI